MHGLGLEVYKVKGPKLLPESASIVGLAVRERSAFQEVRNSPTPFVESPWEHAHMCVYGFRV